MAAVKRAHLLIQMPQKYLPINSYLIATGICALPNRRGSVCTVHSFHYNYSH